MKLEFVCTSYQMDEIVGWHKSLPRNMRKALRVVSHKTVSKDKLNTHDGVDSYMRTEFRVDTGLLQNLEFLDRSYEFDEFGDIDDEYEGLTITPAMTEAELFEFCTGYNTL